MDQSVDMKMKKHDHYYRSVKGLDKIDVYRVLELFDVTCPVAQHVIKKAMVAGKRGHKDTATDWENIRDSALRKLEMMGEDNLPRPKNGEEQIVCRYCGGGFSKNLHKCPATGLDYEFRRHDE